MFYDSQFALIETVKCDEYFSKRKQVVTGTQIQIHFNIKVRKKACPTYDFVKMRKFRSSEIDFYGTWLLDDLRE